IVLTIEAIRHGFIRNLLSFQFSEILNANTEADQSAVPATESAEDKAARDAQALAKKAQALAKKDLIALAAQIEAAVRKDKPNREFPFDKVSEHEKQLTLLADFADSLYCSDQTLKSLTDNFNSTSKVILEPGKVFSSSP
ncbi:MAG: hypothetical protein NTV34_01195, partial [Proteobacteria bacterium]|nr:hypothetical protein [Pseudomonadota bacterium]